MDDETLIEAVRAFPCLWDTKCKAYKELRTKENAWKEVQKQLQGSTIEDLTKRWKSIWDKYVREQKKIKGSKKSGEAGPPYVPGWPMFQILSFLQESISHRPTTCNMPDSSPGPSRRSSTSSSIQLQQSPPLSNFDVELGADSDGEEMSSSTRTSRTSSPLPKRRNTGNELDELIYQRFAEPKKALTEDDLFGRQVASNLARFTPYDNGRAKMKIQEVLFDIEFGGEGEDSNSHYYKL